MILPASLISDEPAPNCPPEDSIPLPLATVQREMADPPPPQRFFTTDGLPPNAGVPYHRLFMGVPPNPQPAPPVAAPTAPQPAPKRYYTTDGKPPNNGLPINESAVQSSEEQLLCALLARLSARMQLQITVATTIPAPVPKDANCFVRGEVLYLFPEKHANINFLYAGHRPCDQQTMWTQNFPYKLVKLPLSMTVGEMANRLGNPGRDLQEMVELTQPTPQGTTWGPGRMLPKSGPSSEKTLQEIGWDARGEDDPAWVVHGPFWV